MKLSESAEKKTHFVICKTGDKAAVRALQAQLNQSKNQAAQYKKLFHFKKPLQLWQALVEHKNELDKIRQYGSADFSMYLGNINVTLVKPRGQALFYGQEPYFERGDSPYEVTENILLWGIKPSSSDREHFVRRLSKHGIPRYGLTEKGLKQLLAQIKQQPLFKALDHPFGKVASDEHHVLIGGEFKDSKGHRHQVLYEIYPTYAMLTVQ